MKKLISKIALVAFALAMVPTADAAGVDITASADVAVDTVTVVMPAGLGLTNAAGDDITLQLTTTSDGAAVDLLGQASVTATVGGNAETVDTYNANGYIIITDIDNDFAGAGNIVIELDTALTDNTAYTVSYRDSQGNYGVAMFNTGTANQVTVTATVEPVLTMDLSETDLDLGILSTTDYTSADTVDVTTGTNATIGVTVTMAATGLVGEDNGYEIGTSIDAGATDTAATDYYKVQSNYDDNVNTAAAITDANGADAYAAAGIDVTDSQEVANRSVAHSGYTTTVTIAAKAAVDTQADEYTDVLTFTATANF